MKRSSTSSTDIAFTPSVKAIQSRKGSRGSYERVEAAGGWRTRISPRLATFIAERDTAFLATANEQGQPYVQHRGGPPGFLRVLDERTIAFADFVGNRQYITQGNLAVNPKAHLILIDYREARRIKIWGEAIVVEDDDELLAKLTPEGYAGVPEQAIVLTVTVWDVNCPQHIPRMWAEAEVAAALAERDRKIGALEAELAELRATRSRS